MSPFRRYSFVLPLCIVLCLLFALFGVHRSVSKQAAKVEKSFTTGVREDGYTQPSVRGQLVNRARAALNLWTLAEDDAALSEKAQRLLNARRALVSLLEAKKLSPAALCAADKEMGEAFAALYSAVSDEDRASAAGYKSAFDGAALTITESGYNEAVERFNKNVLGVFPVNILRYPAFVKAPEFFK